MDDRTLAFLRELERADEEAAATLAELDELAAEVERIRTSALELEAFLSALPEEHRRTREAVEDAEREVAEGRAGLDAIEASDDPVSQRATVRARDALRLAERRLEGARMEAKRLEGKTRAAERESQELEARAGKLARALSSRAALASAAGHAPAGGLDGILRWATDARAALFVGRGNLAKIREALIRQANELGALVLGDPLSAQRPADVASRIERHDK